MNVSTSTRLLLVLLAGGGFLGCRARSHTAPMAARPTETVVSYWDLPLHESNPKSLAVAEHQFQTILRQSHFELNSEEPFQMVRIPLKILGYRPYVQTVWSNRQVDCLFDTGAWSTVWPQWMHLDTRQLDFAQNERGPQGAAIRGEWVLSPKIVIGDLTLINMPTEAMGIPQPSTEAVDRQPQHASVVPDLQSDLSSPTLGIFAFSPGVITIDYTHKELIVRNQDYDVTRLARSPHTLLIHYQKDSARRIILMGTLAGRPARFLVDTGSNVFCVSSAFVQNNLSYIPKPGNSVVIHSTTHSSPAILDNISGTLSGIPLVLRNVHVVERAGGVDALLGWPFFHLYRVTIDPFRHVLLLEEVH